MSEKCPACGSPLAKGMKRTYDCGAELTAGGDVLTSSALCLRRQRGSLRQRVVELKGHVETLLDYIAPKCDDNMSPVWCCSHSRKRCTGEADVAAARAALKEPT